MNRKLRHSISALSASAAVLAIALMVAVPASAPDLSADTTGAAGALVRAATVSAGAAAPARAVGAGRVMDAGDTAPRKDSRRRRQTLVMPYFSFLPRG